MNPDQELEIWWRAYLAALGGASDQSYAVTDMECSEMADRALDTYKAKRKELLNES